MKIHFPLFFVPQQSVYIVERLGKYHRSLPAGLNIILPFFDKISYIHSLKEQTHQIEAQQAITRDNVFIHIDAVAYLKVTDAYKCSYGAEDPIEYAQTLSKSIMRSEIGKLSLDKTFESRELLNQNILQQLRAATEEWGISFLRYEIKDIKMSESIHKIMNLQAESERQKRADILLSEGKKQEMINIAFAEKQSTVMEAQGEGEKIFLYGQAVSNRISMLNNVIQEGGREAIQFKLAEKYIDTLSGLKGKNIILKADLNDPQKLVDKASNFLQK